MNIKNKDTIEFAISVAIGKLATLIVDRDSGIREPSWLIKTKNLPEFINEVREVMMNELKRGAKCD